MYRSHVYLNVDLDMPRAHTLCTRHNGVSATLHYLRHYILCDITLCVTLQHLRHYILCDITLFVTLHTRICWLYIVQCIRHSVQCNCTHCTLYNVYSVQSVKSAHSVNCTIYTIQCTLYTVQYVNTRHIPTDIVVVVNVPLYIHIYISTKCRMDQQKYRCTLYVSGIM